MVVSYFKHIFLKCDDVHVKYNVDDSFYENIKDNEVVENNVRF